MDALLLVLVGVWCFTTALMGGLVGLVLGNIRLPVLVLVASSPAAGAGANIGVSAVSAFAAAFAHIRAGRMDWRLFAWMAPPSMVGAVIGGLLSGAVPSNALLIAIGVTLVVFAVDLLRPKPNGRQPEAGRVSARAAILTGALIGLLGGFVGLILGALRLPALLRFNAVTPRVGFGAAVGVGAATSVPGAILGARLTGRLDEPQLLRAVGLVLLLAGAAMIVQGIVY